MYVSRVRLYQGSGIPIRLRAQGDEQAETHAFKLLPAGQCLEPLFRPRMALELVASLGNGGDRERPGTLKRA